MLVKNLFEHFPKKDSEYHNQLHDKDVAFILLSLGWITLTPNSFDALKIGFKILNTFLFTLKFQNLFFLSQANFNKRNLPLCFFFLLNISS